MSAYEEAAKIDASKGWYANREHFEAAALAIVSKYVVIYDEVSDEVKLEVTKIAGNYVGSKFVEWDQEFGWDFPYMSDGTEDQFLYIYGYAKARAVLTGELKMSDLV